MVAGVRLLCTSDGLVADVTDFLQAHPVEVGQRTVTQTLERLAINRAFGERTAATLAAVLAPYT
jgi:hypothetical protein